MLHTTAGLITHCVFLNATKPPFNNRDARRAVAYALDRGALTSDQNLFSGPVTCQLIPPGFSAYRPYCPYTRGTDINGTWSVPDKTTARALVTKSGTQGASVVLVVDNNDPAPRMVGRRVVTMLDRLGYRASLQVVPLDAYFYITGNPDKNWNAG